MWAVSLDSIKTALRDLKTVLGIWDSQGLIWKNRVKESGTSKWDANRIWSWTIEAKTLRRKFE